jgi:hypothetical protein
MLLAQIPCFFEVTKMYEFEELVFEFTLLLNELIDVSLYFG